MESKIRIAEAKVKAKYNRANEKLTAWVKASKILEKADISYGQGVIQKLKMELNELEKQVLCAHLNIGPFEYIRHDSRNDFYSQKCKDCKLEINSQSR